MKAFACEIKNPRSSIYPILTQTNEEIKFFPLFCYFFVRVPESLLYPLFITVPFSFFSLKAGFFSGAESPPAA